MGTWDNLTCLQRLSLARALVNNPTLLLLDELANGLDPRSRIELRQLVRDLAAEGRAVLVSSHGLSELDEMVDEAVFMTKGRTLGADADAMVAKARTTYRVVALDHAILLDAPRTNGHRTRRRRALGHSCRGRP